MDTQEELPLETEVEAEASPVDDGVAEVEATQPEEATPEHDFLELGEGDTDKYVTIKIDGEDRAVPLQEALAGYSRTEVFTQKTQAAAEALRLQQAFQTNPGLTVSVLANQANMSVEEYLGLSTPQQQAAVAEPEPEYADPLEKALAEERQQRVALQDRFEAREADEALGQAIGGLKQQFGATDDQSRAVVQQALNMGLGVESFPMIYQSMSYQAQQQAQAQQTATQDTATAQRQAAAQAAGQVVSSGSGAVGTVEAKPAEQFTSIREATLAAFEEIESKARS